MNVLVLNPGSATLKFGVYQMPDEHTASPSATVVTNGVIEGTGAPAHAVEAVIRRLFSGSEGTKATTPIHAVGCRVVHGGATLVQPTRVTASVLDELRAMQDLAPLHIPADIAVLEQVRQSLPGIPVIAVFDTAFHQTLPDVARTYALPVELCTRYGLRRYGFHGISHAYLSRRLIERLGRGALGTKIITCHLGSGASVCAVRDGHSIDTSMGLTPLEGLVMRTRSGDVDPGLVLHLLRTAGMTVDDVDDLLNHQSGLRGLSGLSGDVRDLERAALENDPRAELALAMFAYRTCKYIGAFAAALAGLDAVVFSGGIGEHSDSMRTRICRHLAFLGLRLDDDRNRAPNGREMQISVEGGDVQAWVIPTDEELEIATSTHDLISGGLST